MSSVLDIARAEVGVTEWPPKSNHVKYWSDLAPDLQGSAWCAAFVAWCWQRAGIDLVRELVRRAARSHGVATEQTVRFDRQRAPRAIGHEADRGHRDHRQHQRRDQDADVAGGEIAPELAPYQ